MSAGDGVYLIQQERRRQIEKFGEAHDDAHDDAELARQAAALANPSPPTTFDDRFDDVWNLRAEYEANQVNRISQLQVAGALIAAEIDRLIRAEAPP